MPKTDLLRRGFLKRTAGAGLIAATRARAEALPDIAIGNKRVSRLIAGSNPIAAYSYGTAKPTAHMQNYFTVERTTEFLLHCERPGITTFQGHLSPKIRSALLAARELGSEIQFIRLASDYESGVPKESRTPGDSHRPRRRRHRQTVSSRQARRRARFREEGPRRGPGGRVRPRNWARS